MTTTSPKMSPEVLAKILADHVLWLRGDPKGSRANLADANLADADLAGANLTRAYLAGANLAGANLTRAYLASANLADANLADADLAGANLAGANLARADLTGADLIGADLTDANLTRANLTRAYLAGANLARADLTGADLASADLTGADLTDAYLTRANLAGIRDDVREVLSRAPAEVPGLLAALKEGRVDGSQYEGECACLVGTIAKVRGCSYEQLSAIRPDASRPAERFYLGIRRGDTPKTSQVSALAVQWIEEWLSEQPSSPTPDPSKTA